MAGDGLVVFTAAPAGETDPSRRTGESDDAGAAMPDGADHGGADHGGSNVSGAAADVRRARKSGFVGGVADVVKAASLKAARDEGAGMSGTSVPEFSVRTAAAETHDPGVKDPAANTVRIAAIPIRRTGGDRSVRLRRDVPARSSIQPNATTAAPMSTNVATASPSDRNGPAELVTRCAAPTMHSGCQR